MRRRERPLVTSGNGALPPELRNHLPRTREAIEQWVRPDEHPPKDWGLWGHASEGFWRFFEAQRRQRAAAEEWCRARGHSYCRTVLGWRRPSQHEVSAGRVTVPGE